MRNSLAVFFLSLLSILGFLPQLPAQQVDTTLLTEMKWRNVGPFRGGRTRAVAGVPSQPNVFYIGAVNGGVWKTTDYGRTWNPIFDHEPTGSIGALAVSPSDPNIVYVGSGEGLHRPDLSVGDGIYKSTDAGATWTHLGLRDGQQISADGDRCARSQPPVCRRRRTSLRTQSRARHLSLDRRRPELPAGSLQEREHRRRDVKIDPSNPQIVYATLWEAREGPWENGDWNGTDGGHLQVNRRRRHLEATQQAGFPRTWSRPYLSISHSNPQQLFAVVARKNKSTEFYHSADAGETWSTVTTDPRPQGRIGGGGDLADAGHRSQESRRHLRHQHCDLEVDRRRQDLDRLSRRARRRRLPEHLDQSQQLQASSSSPATRARSSPSMAARAGVRGTTSRRRSFIT